MYKMKQVCQMTGLTEKAIRIYMDQKLISPKVEEGVHRKAYFFSEEDVDRLKDILTLRNAGFSIAEIKQMLENPEMLSTLIEEKKELLEGEILQKLALQDTLKDLTIEEHSDVTKLANAIEPRTAYAKETPKKKWSRKKKWFVVVLLLAVFLGFYGLVNGKDAVWVGVGAISLVFGITAVISGIRYRLYHAKTQKMSSRAVGKITAVVENEKIEEYIGERDRSTSREFLAYIAFGMFGEGIWNTLRPDAWYPVISYQSEDGAFHTATTRFGAFRKSWQVGETVDVTWEDGKENMVHICSEKIFLKKAKRYFMIGVALFMLFGIGMWSLFGEQEAIDVSKRLKYPVVADRVEMKIEGKQYELDEEEIKVLKKWLDEAEMKSAEKYIFWDKEGFLNISFYQGDSLIERFVVNDTYYVYAMDGMKYWVGPLKHMELHGTDIGDNLYTTVFLGNLKANVLERYAVEEITYSILEREELQDLKELLEVTEYFDGAYFIQDGYRFYFTEQGFMDFWGRQPGEEEKGFIDVNIVDGEFRGAVSMNYCMNESGEIEEENYGKEWR